jgi:hypothetical protein
MAACAQPAAYGSVRRDFDRDGVEERVVDTASGIEVQRPSGQTGAWEKVDWTLPAGLRLADEEGRDAGLRFVDLNEDGFEDILFSNADGYAIHLWNKSVQPHLGWTRGWSQFVKAGKRTGAKGEPPSVTGAEVRVAEGVLTIVRRAGDGQGGAVA